MIDAPGEWYARGRCAETDPEAFFPEKGGSVREAKRVCESCEVRDQCLEYALTHRITDGVWGGTTGRERRRLGLTVIKAPDVRPCRMCLRPTRPEGARLEDYPGTLSRKAGLCPRCQKIRKDG